MEVTTLVRITPAGPPRRPAVRALLETARCLQRMAGFRRWQTFRALDASDALFVAVDWETTEAQKRAVSDAGIRSAATRAATLGFTLTPVEVLSTTFQRQLAVRDSVATLLRVSHTGEVTENAAARESDLALHALAAPGSTRLHGARNESGTAAMCRIDFDTEDGIWHFLESPLRKNWSSWAESGREEETWALNLPRFEYHRAPSGRPSTARVAKPQNLLCLQLEISDDRAAASIRFEGCLDPRGSSRSEQVCEALIRDGCRRLEVDVSELAKIPAEAVGMLTRVARSVKERGGQFVLIENDERVKRVTRSKHLEASVRR
jgi:anti-anti-sigma factor